MSQMMATISPSAKGPPGAQTEQRPRILLQPDGRTDNKQESLNATGKSSTSASFRTPYTKPHGDTLPQEPNYHRLWSLSKRDPHIVQHPHQKPWSSSSCPGKKESPEGLNPFHRVWMMETGQRGVRWNAQRKAEFYKKQDADLMSKIPTDQKMCRSDGNYKFWTHLNNGGLKAGGQDEKLDYTYRGPNTVTNHFYLGKYDNVRHVQRIVKTGYTDPTTGKRRELHADKRPQFDNRLHDDMIRNNEEELKAATMSRYDIFRPANSQSCPQLGADFVQRA